MTSDKALVRNQWLAKLGNAPAASPGLETRLEAWAARRGFTTVLATLPLPGEPDLTPLYSRWLKSGTALALARTSEGSMDFAYVPSLDGPWKQNGRLKEPTDGAAAWAPGRRTLVLVPGLAFATAPDGVLRLGRGGGYFDRWLAVHAAEVTTLGVGFAWQLTDTLPREPHDVPLNGWLDDQGFHGLEP